MVFQYFAGQQRTKPWFDLRIGKVTASRLEDWLSVSKAKGKEGQALQKRKDYEKELQYERQFGVAYDNFVSDAMNDGIEFERFAVRQYEKQKAVKVGEVGAWFNDQFVASPDGGVEDEGLVEVKVVRDNTFSSILSDGVPQKHWKQCQGQLWASGRKWCDYIAINLNTKKMKVIRVLPDAEFHEWLELAVPEPITVEPFSDEELYDFVDVIPEGETPKVLTDHSDNTQLNF